MRLKASADGFMREKNTWMKSRLFDLAQGSRAFRPLKGRGFPSSYRHDEFV